MASLKVSIDAKGAKSGATDFAAAAKKVIDRSKKVVEALDTVGVRLSNLTQRLNANTRAFNNAFPEKPIERIIALANSLAAVSNQYDKASIAGANAVNVLHQVAVASNAASASMQTASAVTKLATTAMQGVSKAGAQAATSFRSVGTSISAFAGGLRKLTTAASSARNFLRGIFAGFVAGYGVRQALKTISEFDETITRVGVVAEATTEEFVRLERAARSFGEASRFGATGAAEGLLELAKAGFTTSEAITALPAVMAAAVNGHLSLGQAAEYSANLIRQFNLSATDTEKVVDVLVNTANRTTTDIQELASAMKFAGPVAANLGLDIETTAGVLGTMAQRGHVATVAGTNLRNIMLSLLDPSDKARAGIASLGLTVEELNPTTNALVDVFKRLSAANLDAEAASQIFQRRNVAAALVLSQNTAEMEKLIDQNRKFKGQSVENAKILDQTITGFWERTKAAVQEFILNQSYLGTALRSSLGAVRDFFLILSDSQDKIEGSAKAARLLGSSLEFAGYAIGIGLVTKVALAVAALGSLQAAAHGAGVAVSRMTAMLATHPYIAAAVAIGTVVAAMVSFSDSATDASDDAFELAANQQKLVEINKQLYESLGELKKAREEDDINKQLGAYRAQLKIVEDLQKTWAGAEEQRRAMVSAGKDGTEEMARANRALVLNTAEFANTLRSVGFPELATKYDLLAESAKKYAGVTLYVGQASQDLANVQSFLSTNIDKLNEKLQQGKKSRTPESYMTPEEIEARDKAREKIQELIEESKFEIEILNETAEAQEVLRKARELDEIQIDANIEGYDELRKSYIAYLEKLDYEKAVKQQTAQINEDYVAWLISEQEAREKANQALVDQTNELFEYMDALDDVRSSSEETSDAQKVAQTYTEAYNKALFLGEEAARNYAAQAALSKEITLANAAASKEAAQAEKDRIQAIDQSTKASVEATKQATRLVEDYEFELAVIRLSNEEREKAIALRQLERQAVDGQVEGLDLLKKRMGAALGELQAQEKIKRFSEQLSQAFAAPFEEFILGTMSAKEALQSMLVNIQQAIVREFVTNQIVRAFTSFLSGWMTGAGSTPYSSQTGVHDFARGGVVPMARGGYFTTGPEIKPMANGALSLRGEAGMEAVMPLKRDSQGRLGVSGAGGGTVIQNIYITTPDADSFRKSRSQIMQDIRRGAV